VSIPLDEARNRGDKDADDVIAVFRAARPDLAARDIVGAMVAQLHRGPDNRSEEVQQYLLDGPELPSWADEQLIAQGQAFFRSYGLVLGAALFCASLPEAYAAAEGVEVLAFTAELVSNPRRRIAETGRFLVDVMALDGTARSLAPGERGYRSARGVRLMHAAVRALVTDEKGPDWVAEHGVPLNQRDMVGTLLTFTSVAYAALDRLGIEYHEDDVEAHLHTWCVIGHLLGIDDDLLPWSRYEADQLTAVLRTQMFRASPAGTLLARALLDEQEELMPPLCRAVPRTVTRHLIGDTTADLLQLPKGAWWRGALRGVDDIAELGGVHGPSAILARSLSRLVCRSLFMQYIEQGLQGKRAPFEIPDEIVSQWRLRKRRLRPRALGSRA
jgi:hypothetical protein